MHGFQLWINLPAAQKMTVPEYQEIRPQAIPEIEVDDAVVPVVAGDMNGWHGPVSDPNTQFQYLDVSLPAGGEFNHGLPENDTTFVYLFEGSASVADSGLQGRQLAVLDRGERLSVQAGSDGARFLLVAGRAIGEPIVQYGPFVMNTRTEIERALKDYSEGRLVQTKADMINH